jgi:hypothetical protein
MTLRAGRVLFRCVHPLEQRKLFAARFADIFINRHIPHLLTVSTINNYFKVEDTPESIKVTWAIRMFERTAFTPPANLIYWS